MVSLTHTHTHESLWVSLYFREVVPRIHLFAILRYRQTQTSTSRLLLSKPHFSLCLYIRVPHVRTRDDWPHCPLGGNQHSEAVITPRYVHTVWKAEKQLFWWSLVARLTHTHTPYMLAGFPNTPADLLRYVTLYPSLLSLWFLFIPLSIFTSFHISWCVSVNQSPHFPLSNSLPLSRPLCCQTCDIFTAQHTSLSLCQNK